jgi:hypothetical protein
MVLIDDSVKEMSFDLKYATTELRNIKIDHMNDLSVLRMDLEQLKEQTEAQIKATGKNHHNIING